MRLPIYQVDAFTDRVFAGNPAAVCPLPEWLPAAAMQAIAAENNLAETAFFVPAPGGAGGTEFELRWFTPELEIDLCGHATLASAFVLFRLLEPGRTSVAFSTRSGPVAVTLEGGELLALDFPARPPQPCEAPPTLAEALGRFPDRILKARDYLAIFDTAAEVSALRPDFARLRDEVGTSVIATAPADPGTELDFVSRFFAPDKGVNEDPVTGSAHCTLIPYWADRLGTPHLRARQVSPRGGDLVCEHHGDRVKIAGHAVLYLEGTISV
jgi:PhzF family phenazine biosynthesis protein